MKVFKPNDLALLYRAYRFADRNMLSLGMLAMFPLGETGRTALAQESELWKTATGALADLGIDTPLDEGWAKPRAEFMVVGAAFAPGAATGAQVAQIAINARLGNLAKQLYVFGDRDFGRGGLPTAARPFCRMPLGAAQAFGGAGFADNPQGKGLTETVGPDGLRRRPLPNVEHPRHMMAALGDRPVPGGYIALGPDHSLRRACLGKFDQRWIREDWPQLPEDTRPDYFMVAPPDQRLPDYLRGEEVFELEHMHPSRARLGGQLPGLRPRCLLHRRLADGHEEIAELQPRAETVWFFPEQERGVILYRATIQTLDSDADDVLHAMLEWEQLNEPALPFEQLQASFRQKMAASQPAPQVNMEPPKPAVAPVAALTPLAAAIPVAAMPATDIIDPELQALEKLTAGLQSETETLLRRHGLTRDDIIRPPTEPPDVSTEQIESLTRQLEADTKALLTKYGLSEADIVRPPSEAPDTSLEALQAATQQMEEQKTALLQKYGVTEAQIQSELARQGQTEAAQFISDAPKALAEQKQALDVTAAASATVPPIPAVSPVQVSEPAAWPTLPVAAPAKLVREDVIARHARGESLAGLDLSALDLSGLDLSGAIFSESLLTGTSFRESQLGGARFEGALLQKADFSQSDLHRAVLSDASAAQAIFASARLEEADLERGDFSGADFSDAHLPGAELGQAVFAGAAMDGVQARGCKAAQVSFAGCSLVKADLSGALLTAAGFGQAKAVDIRLAGSMCDNADFHGAQMPGADFTGASLQGSRAGLGSVFDGGVFSAAQMTGASWEGASARSARFDQATLDQSDLSRLQAQDAIFAGASARGARLAKADLTGADLSAINLFKGSLRKAKVERAVMHHANLYGVDVEEVKISRGALEGADTGQTLLQVRPPT
ncbi:UNVERIFIED_ORG: uncharacterized protein YjbI with pentapeptide repeats [Herbaspirillum seropedicae]